MLPLEVFNNKSYLANIIFFAEVASRFRITFNIDIESTINLHIDNGTRIKFNQCSGGLYYYETTNMENKNTNNQVTDYYYLITVQSNKQ